MTQEANNDRLRIYIVRHGITAWNREMRMQGHTDIPLDTEGELQAEKLAARLSASPYPPQWIYASDLSRARETAAFIARPLGLSVQTTPLLRETNLGTWEGMTRAEIEARGEGELLTKYQIDSYVHRPPGSETLDAVWDRMIGVMNEIRHAHPTGQVAIVGHGGSLRALLCAALESPITSMRRLWLDNASLSIIEETGSSEYRIERVVLINDTGHLAGPSAK